jgi:Trypsin-co-occurring domain 2
MTEKANSDELSIFVSSTLKAIASGVADAQETQISSAHGTGVFGFNAPTDVEFDVAVSAKQTGTEGGGLKVAVFGIGANVGGQVGSENSSISRIRFSVPTNFKEHPKSAVAISYNTKVV